MRGAFIHFFQTIGWKLPHHTHFLLDLSTTGLLRGNSYQFLFPIRPIFQRGSKYLFVVARCRCRSWKRTMFRLGRQGSSEMRYGPPIPKSDRCCSQKRRPYNQKRRSPTTSCRFTWIRDYILRPQFAMAIHFHSSELFDSQNGSNPISSMPQQSSNILFPCKINEKGYYETHLRLRKQPSTL